MINKIDLKTAKPEEVAKQMKTVFALDESEIIKVSDHLPVVTCYKAKAPCISQISSFAGFSKAGNWNRSGAAGCG